MSFKRGLPAAVAAAVLAVPGAAPVTASASAARSFTPGAAGIGDPYFPLDGNGGYDVRHYRLDLRYEPATDRLSGVATLRARATQSLSRFNLDLVGLDVRAITVNRRPAHWRRDGGELIIRPREGLRRRRAFTVAVVYDGVPEPMGEPELGGQSGFVHTDDGAVVAGQLDAAPTWFPVNDHPSDKAAYTFRLTVPAGLEAIANGVLEGLRTRGGWSTWTWDAREPMAPYLTTAAIGEFDLRAHRAHGVRYWDAIDPDLFTGAPAPRTGTRFAISQRAGPSYKRLARTIEVPAGGGRVTFWVRRDTEPSFDYMFVEAHPVGSGDWTMLPDLNGHSSADPGPACTYLLLLHPFLGHYESGDGDGTCSPRGTTGSWSAATGASDGYEQWAVDLSPYAGRRIELSISSASDDSVNFDGLVVDDVVVAGGPGTTSFEDDGDPLDGWHVPGPPPGSPPNANDWIAGTAADAPPGIGGLVEEALDRQPEIIDFLEQLYGRYPFAAAGGIVDDTEMIGFALETQTRPFYSRLIFTYPEHPVDRVVAHELAHQWTGNDVALARWQDVWLNEGFATYVEWLWSEHEGRETAQEIYDGLTGRPADDPVWSVVIADPGPEALFDSAVYARGAATLHALRLEIGEEDFFRVLRRWTRVHAGGNVSTTDFTTLAERVSGRDLRAFFDEWLYTAAKPPGIPVSPAGPAERGRSRTR